MTITRRTLIKQLMLGAGAAALLPSCVFDKKEKAVDGTAFLLSKDQNQLLADIAETIIPKTSTPGAKELKVEEFINVMVTDCFDKETQDKFSKGLTAINDLSEKRFDKLFTEITQEQRNQLFSDIATKQQDISADLTEFFPLVKGLTIRGYMASEYIMTEVNPWPLVPGPSKGCVEVKAA